MQGLVGERVLMRIHIGEADKHDGKPLYVDDDHLSFHGAVNLLGRPLAERIWHVY